jgi:hypothetical protein
MSDEQLLEKVSKLPEGLKSEVVDFIDFLLKKRGLAETKYKPVFGSGKGMFFIKPGFDEPLEDFKDYM